jgi:Fanconi anemia group M protein
MKQIFDIFSRREQKEKAKITEKPKIIADYREKNSMVISELTSLGIETETRELKVADYLINGIAIERKTVSDFLNSMKNQRLVKQLEELQQYESKILIIEGLEEQELYSDSETTGMHPNSIRGFLLSILLRYKVPIIFTKNYEDTAKFLSVLSKKKERESPINAKKKSLSKKERLQFILEGFPGIGPKTAKKLLKKFTTIQNVINADSNELKEILGKKTDIVKSIIEQKY